jgi:uncharacterized SAM-binding protein YcdF (DUF218 family)
MLREIAVVLGGGIRTDGTPTEATLARARAAADLVRPRDLGVILSGGHGGGARRARSEAALMRDVLVERGIDPSRIYLEDASVDTLTNAVNTAVRYLAALAPRPLILVTSPFHMARALETFALVLGPAWPLAAHPSASGPSDAQAAAREAGYLAGTRERLRGTTPGDIGAISARVRATMRAPELG